ncbi:MAG TPA: hypothetical protein VHK70_00165 [Burkholderiaceae bacterium]|nr:hypothetical protein [Burkholderiaceae bacterium]
MDTQLPLPLCSDDIVEALVVAACGNSATAQQKHLYRESLRSLVRLAKAEQTQEMEMGFRTLEPVCGEDVLH